MRRKRTQPLLYHCVLLTVLAPLGCTLPTQTLVDSVPDAVAAGRPLPEMQLDQPYSTRADKSLAMDVFLPSTHSGPAALVILIPGGPWSWGFRSEAQRWATELALQGYMAAAIDISEPQDNDPAASGAADVLAAVKHFRENAAQWNIDPQRIALLGTTVNSHLALLVGMASDASIFDSDWPPGLPVGVQAVINRGDPADFLIDPQNTSPAQRMLLALLLSVQQSQGSDGLSKSHDAQGTQAAETPDWFNPAYQERREQILKFLGERLSI